MGFRSNFFTQPIVGSKPLIPRAVPYPLASGFPLGTRSRKRGNKTGVVAR